MTGRKKLWILCFGIFLTLVLNHAVLYGQVAEGDTVRIETVDGNTFTGTVVTEDENEVVIDIDGIGEVTIKKSNIQSMVRLDPERMRQGRYWFENPNSTRYFFAPNAIGLKKGEGYYQNAWIFFNNVNYGVTDHFSIGAGTIPMFLFGVGATPVWLLPKISVPVAGDRLSISSGAMIGTVIGDDNGSTAGIFYGNATYGTLDRNITVGAGYGFADGDVSSSPLVNVSGLYRFTSRSYLLTEIYFVPNVESSGVGFFGYRWSPENFAVDFGLITPLSGTDSYVAVPWFGVSIPFGR